MMTKNITTIVEDRVYTKRVEISIEKICNSHFVQNTTHPGCSAAPPLKRGITGFKVH
jgi:RES domain-containing protein